jgi:hypothetical protein
MDCMTEAGSTVTITLPATCRNGHSMPLAVRFRKIHDDPGYIWYCYFCKTERNKRAGERKTGVWRAPDA